MSAHRIGISRVQYGLFATPFEELIAADNPIRAIDAFVDYLDLEKLGFSHMKPEERGAPAYHPSVLLKLYLYGYYNRIRSSRMLERECGRNSELMWLLGQQKPSYHTIADFRSEEGHPKALKLVFRQLVPFCREADLIGGEKIAVDGSKFRGQNSMKNNFTSDKLDRQIEYNEKKFAEYIDQLDSLDAAAENYPDASDALLTKAEAVMNRIDFHKELQQKLLKTGETQVSLIDPDARALPLHMCILQVGYNLQSAVDDRHNLLVHLELTNRKDTNQLAPVAIETKGILHAGRQRLSSGRIARHMPSKRHRNLRRAARICACCRYRKIQKRG
ncbi:MAG: transposase, partial [Bacteroidia bacterium]